MTRLKPLLVLLGAIPTMATLFVVAAPAAHAVATDTTVMIIPPGLGTVNSYNTLTASVTAQDGVTAPVGSIQFRTAAGGCIASTLTVTAISGSGDCSLTAIAPWGQGYDGAATTTVLKLEPGRQSANINQSIATTVVGQRVNLITGDNRTNAGIGITWQVVKGAANCIITSGAHFAQVRVLGPCTISGAARKVPGLWAPFEVTQILDPSIRGQSGN